MTVSGRGIPKKLIELLEENKEIVDAFVLEKSQYNRHRLNTLLSANGFTSSRDRDKYIELVSRSRRWGRV
jgi:hypothetical protein